MQKRTRCTRTLSSRTISLRNVLLQTHLSIELAQSPHDLLQMRWCPGLGCTKHTRDFDREALCMNARMPGWGLRCPMPAVAAGCCRNALQECGATGRGEPSRCPIRGTRCDITSCQASARVAAICVRFEAGLTHRAPSPNITTRVKLLSGRL